MMASFGWHVDAVADGTEAMSRLEQACQPAAQPYTLVFVDWQLPGMDGWQVIAQMRLRCSAKGHRQPHYVMVSANGRASLELRTLEEQAMINDFLVKPVTASMLYNAALDKTAANPSLRRLPRSSISALAGLRILVVEDNAINQQVAEELLGTQGADVSIAADGEIAVNAIAAARTPYDIVLIDVQMPAMDGFEATKIIRQEMGLPDLPIVGLTANAMASDREDCLRAGMNEHIGKPFDLARLVSVVIRLTGHKPAGTSAASAVDQAAGAGKGLASPTEAFLASSRANATIDFAASLSRMGGMEQLYLRSAKDLMVVLPTFISTLTTALQARDRKRSAMLLHTIKSNAATLGLNPLANLLANLEMLCKSDTGLADCANQLDALAQFIDDALAGLTTVLRQLEMDAGEETPIGTKVTGAQKLALQKAIAKLISLMEAEDFGALEVFAEERGVLDGMLPALLSTLEAAVQDLDWSKGLHVLKQFASASMFQQKS